MLQTKMMLKSFLTTWKVLWMMQYLPMLESMSWKMSKKRADETIDALVDHICHFANHTLIGDSSDADVEYKVQCRLIHAIPDGDMEL